MTPEQTIADAIRNVTVAVQRAIENGPPRAASSERCAYREFRPAYRRSRGGSSPHRGSRTIDADDLVEVLLAVADQLDPPVRDPA